MQKISKAYRIKIINTKNKLKLSKILYRAKTFLPCFKFIHFKIILINIRHFPLTQKVICQK